MTRWTWRDALLFVVAALFTVAVVYAAASSEPTGVHPSVEEPLPTDTACWPASPDC